MFELFILLLLISYPSICALLYTPALPSIAQQFQILDKEAQTTMSLFLVGYTLGMLPYGPIANRYGRRIALLSGLVLASVGTLVSLLAFSLPIFCLGRFLQALGAAAGLKITFTMIGDRHQGHGATRALAVLTLAFGIMPGIGVALGGYLTMAWGWHGCFAFLLLYSLFLIGISLFLPETAKSLDPNALQLRKIFHGYFMQLKHPLIVLNGIMMGLASAIIYIFGTVAPIVSIRLIGMAPDEFGLWNIVPSFGLVAGTLLASSLAGKQKNSVSLFYGMILMFIGSIAIGFCFVQGWIYASAFFLPMFLVQAGDNLFWINASSSGLSSASDKSNASAIMQFLNIGIASIGTFVSMNFSPKNPLVLPIAFVVIVGWMLIIWYTAQVYQKRTQRL